MALVLANRVQQNGTANTTVSFTLSGSITGYQSFSVIGNGNTTYYSAIDTSSNWEIGLGTYSTSGPTLTRTTVLASSNSNSAVTFSGTVTVWVDLPAGKAVSLDANNNLPAVILAAGTASAAPLTLTSGTNLTSAAAGSVEYDGSNFYTTPDTSQGRNVIHAFQQFYLSAAGGALTGATQNYFGSTSAASLAAGSTYDIDCFCYFLKTSSGTVQWIPTFSSAVTVGHSYLEYTPVTGFTTSVITGSMVTSEATQQTTTVLTHSATSSLTTAVYHVHKLRIRVTTNLACNFRLNNTIGTGSITPQAGSFYTVRKVVTSAGNFVA
jgi:hypothetical protein